MAMLGVYGILHINAVNQCHISHSRQPQTYPKIIYVYIIIIIHILNYINMPVRWCDLIWMSHEVRVSLSSHWIPRSGNLLTNMAAPQHVPRHGRQVASGVFSLANPVVPGCAQASARWWRRRPVSRWSVGARNTRPAPPVPWHAMKCHEHMAVCQNLGEHQNSW
jgi:hypothetical protein